MDDIFGKPGARCGECGRLLEAISRYCPGCGSNAVEAVEDVVEIAIEQALEQRAALELVRSGVARQLMSERGPMAPCFVGNASNTLSIWPLYDPRSNGKWKKLRQISRIFL